MITVGPREKLKMGSVTPFRLQAGLKTRRGAARERNEDAGFIDPDDRFFVVADGIGGNRAGHVASRLAVRLLSQSLHSLCRASRPAPQVVEKLHRIFSDANELIITARGNDPRLQGMGTTAAVAVIQRGWLYAAGLGDSRVYLIRGGDAIPLTVDHTVAQALVDSGILPAKESRFHPYRNVLHKFLGCSEFADGPCIECVQLEPGDRLVLATDGLTDDLGEEELAAVVGESATAQRAADALACRAAERGSTDDITCVTVFVEPPPSSER